MSSTFTTDDLEKKVEGAGLSRQIQNNESVLALLGLEDNVTKVESSPPLSQNDLDPIVPETPPPSDVEADKDGITIVKESPPLSDTDDSEEEVTVVKESPPLSDVEENEDGPTVEKKARLSSPECNVPQPSPVAIANPDKDMLTTGCSIIDFWLRGGIPTFGITDLCGEKGSGRSQLCMQLAITAQLPKSKGGLDSCVLYICSEASFVLRRFEEIASHFRTRFPDDLPANPANNVYVIYLADSKKLREFFVGGHLNKVVKMLPKQLRLIILDGFAGFFRMDLESFSSRFNMRLTLAEVGTALREYSISHKAAIVVSNDVSTNPINQATTASLGQSWRRMVSHRLRLRRISNQLDPTMTVEFSSHFFSLHGISVRISSNGIKAVL